MSRPRSGRQRGSGDPDLDERLEDLLDAAGVSANRDQLRDLLVTVVRLASDRSDRLDLKIANAALREMADGFELFAPYRAVRKITMFGSARTAASDPLYAQARDLAALLAAHHWSTVTGAGPGIMAAGLEGAGPDHAFGINIRLPFEQGANEFIASDPKLVSMKYFFTRKLLLIKESYGYAVLPGGFGTLDEAFELLTLLQTGKAEPAPVVLLDVPGGTYWHGWEEFVVQQVAARNLIADHDRRLYRIVDNVDDAAAEILGFYRNFHSLRWVGDTLVIRLERRPTEEEATELTDRFGDIVRGAITVLDRPLAAERRADEFAGLARVALRFDRLSYARLRDLIDALNVLDSAPPPVVLR
ncbi:Rossman fold protein, TIGR00730 family [Acidimicrobiaceae bacterium USS-CC1]|uniref:Rossman fold protein, TIGR00730 family n=1 Tax=Acidiferrimicrobium australe TaxID=2664430 RepID=A0ABW9R1A7_9ACTN|nr:Rossman fold protein, TIGR00730 family [Acidiferrimicrobium australe]